MLRVCRRICTHTNMTSKKSWTTSLRRIIMQVINGAIALTRKVYDGDEVAIHSHDYDWLLDPVVKVRRHLVTPNCMLAPTVCFQGNHDRIQVLVKECCLAVNCQNRDPGNRYA